MSISERSHFLTGSFLVAETNNAHSFQIQDTLRYKREFIAYDIYQIPFVGLRSDDINVLVQRLREYLKISSSDGNHFE